MHMLISNAVIDIDIRLIINCITMPTPTMRRVEEEKMKRSYLRYLFDWIDDID